MPSLSIVTAHPQDVSLGIVWMGLRIDDDQIGPVAKVRDSATAERFLSGSAECVDLDFLARRDGVRQLTAGHDLPPCHLAGRTLRSRRSGRTCRALRP